MGTSDVWTGADGTSNYSDPLNWINAPDWSGDDIYVLGNYTVNLDVFDAREWGLTVGSGAIFNINGYGIETSNHVNVFGSGLLAIGNGAVIDDGSMLVGTGSEITIDGGNLTLDGYGTLELDGVWSGSGYVNVYGTVDGAGTIVADGVGRTLTIGLYVNSSFSGPALEINAGATLQVDGPISAAKSVTFASTTGALMVAGVPMTSVDLGTISGFAGSDMITLESFGAGDILSKNSATNTITITSADKSQSQNYVFAEGTSLNDIVLSASQIPNSSIYQDVLTIEEQVACYCLGTRVLTARGEVEVEALSIGDHVMTRDNGLQPIRWIGHRPYRGRFLMANRNLLPICFKKGSLAENVPHRDLWVSIHHAMYIDGLLIEAKDLRNDVSIYQVDSADEVDYFHIELENHDVIIAEGAFSETFLDDGNRGMFRNAHEYNALYGADDGVPVRYCAPRLESGFEVQAVRRRLALRAGAAREALRARAPALRGYVDKVDTRSISGWAQTVENPEAPVFLEIFVDGRMIGCALANVYRADLDEAGLGSGRHGFELVLPPELTVSPGAVDVRRALDGTPLTRSAALGPYLENREVA